MIRTSRKPTDTAFLLRSRGLAEGVARTSTSRARPLKWRARNGTKSSFEDWTPSPRRRASCRPAPAASAAGMNSNHPCLSRGCGAHQHVASPATQVAGAQRHQVLLRGLDAQPAPAASAAGMNSNHPGDWYRYGLSGAARPGAQRPAGLLVVTENAGTGTSNARRKRRSPRVIVPVPGFPGHLPTNQVVRHRPALQTSGRSLSRFLSLLNRRSAKPAGGVPPPDPLLSLAALLRKIRLRYPKKYKR